MTTDGSDGKLLGRPMRVHDAYLYGVDASVLDWRGGQDGKILMQRRYGRYDEFRAKFERSGGNWPRFFESLVREKGGV